MQIVSQSVSASGKISCHYRYTLHNGVTVDKWPVYLPSGANVSADLNARVAEVEAQAADNEVQQYLKALAKGLTPLPATHQTATQLRARVVAVLVAADVEQAARYRRVYNELTLITQAQVEAMGYNWVAWQAWLTRFSNLRTAINNYAGLV